MGDGFAPGVSVDILNPASPNLSEGEERSTALAFRRF